MATIGTTSPHAKRLRLESTEAEKLLWRNLRNRQLGGFKFRRQLTIGSCIADFACVEAHLVVEADGGQHGGEADLRRTQYLEQLGWTVLRFWNHEVLEQAEGVLQTILAACQQRLQGKPSPNPLPHVGEG